MARLSTEQKKSNDQVKMGSGNSFTMPSARQDSIAGDEQSVGGKSCPDSGCYALRIDLEKHLNDKHFRRGSSVKETTEGYT